MTPKSYQTSVAFRRALEDRLKAQSRAEGLDLQRLRRSVAFDRLLCRLFASPDAPWLLKGGYAMELRIGAARATKDIDLTLPRGAVSSASGHLLELLQEAAGRNLPADDFFVFTVGTPMLDLQGAPDGGSRFPVISAIGGKSFVKFHLDIGVGDAAEEPFENFTGQDWLKFAGLSPGRASWGLRSAIKFASTITLASAPASALRLPPLPR